MAAALALFASTFGLPLVQADAANSPSPSPAASGSPAASSEKATFGVQPSSATGPDARAYFAFGSTPRGLINDHVAVLNYATIPLTLQVLATDALNTDTGGLTGRPGKDKPTDAGSWIKLTGPTSGLRVPAATASGPGKVILPFSVNVPANASPGDHTGLILAVLSSIAKNAQGVNVRLDQRVGTRVFLRVSGELRAQLEVEDLQATYHPTWNPFSPGSTTLSFNLRNSGNVKLGGLVSAEVKGLFGQRATADDAAQIPLLLPGNAVPLTIEVPGVYPEFREAATVIELPVMAKGDVDPAVSRAEGTVAFWAIPWPVIIAVLVLIALVTLAIWRRRRSSSPPPIAPSGKHASRHATPSNSGAIS